MKHVVKIKASEMERAMICARFLRLECPEMDDTEEAKEGIPNDATEPATEKVDGAF